MKRRNVLTAEVGIGVVVIAVDAGRKVVAVLVTVGRVARVVLVQAVRRAGQAKAKVVLVVVTVGRVVKVAAGRQAAVGLIAGRGEVLVRVAVKSAAGGLIVESVVRRRCHCRS